MTENMRKFSGESKKKYKCITSNKDLEYRRVSEQKPIKYECSYVLPEEQDMPAYLEEQEVGDRLNKSKTVSEDWKEVIEYIKKAPKLDYPAGWCTFLNFLPLHLFDYYKKFDNIEPHAIWYETSSEYPIAVTLSFNFDLKTNPNNTDEVESWIRNEVEKLIENVFEGSIFVITDVLDKLKL